MQRTLAIALLTWKAALRFRLFLVVAVLLIGSVVGLPLLLKDDGTARGFAQILLTYTLSTTIALLGLSNLWLACGILARDIEDGQIQMVATKPIARWQIWLGKWLGLLALNAALLALSGIAVYGALHWRAMRLPPEEQRVLRNEVLVARGSAKEQNLDAELDARADEQLAQRVAKNPEIKANLVEVRKQIREQLKADYQVAPPGYAHIWKISLGPAAKSLKGKPLYLRIKFNSADMRTSGTFYGMWDIGKPPESARWRSEMMSLAPETFHEFEIPPDLFDANGVITIAFLNPDENRVALLFPLEDGMEVLYPQGSFVLNYARGLGIIFCWMALFAALGLAAASLVSFPVAAFFSATVLVLIFCSSTILTNSVKEGTISDYNAEKGGYGHSPVDPIFINAFKSILYLIHLSTETATVPGWVAKALPDSISKPLSVVLPSPPQSFSPVDALSTGRSIPWSRLILAFTQNVVLFCGILALIGMGIFTRRELATAQGTQ